MRPRTWLRARLVDPILRAEASAGQVAWGAGVGMFVALLPMVGQLYVLPVVWAAARTVVRRAFHLPLAYGMVLLINPPVKVFTFYGYLLTGNVLLESFGAAGIGSGWAGFKAALLGTQGGWLSNSWHAAEVALRSFGLPILVGGVLWAAVGGVLAFALAWGIASTQRRRRARTPAPAQPPRAA